jgi:hypothetical protein
VTTHPMPVRVRGMWRFHVVRAVALIGLTFRPPGWDAVMDRSLAWALDSLRVSIDGGPWKRVA